MKKMADVNTREALIRAAESLFGERGFDGVSVREIVAAAKANLGAVTYHFGGKDALFAEVIARRVGAMREMGEAVVRRPGTPEQRLRAIMESYAFHILCDDPKLKVFFSECLAGGHRLPRAALDAMLWRNRVFGSVIEDGVRAGAFRKIDVEYAAWFFFGMLSAFVLHEPLVAGVSREGAYPRAYVRKVVDAAMDVFLNGVRSRGPAGKGAGAGRPRRRGMT